MPTWRSEDITRESLTQKAKKLEVITPAIIEQVIALHDTLNLVGYLFPKEIIFTGGSMINPLYLQDAPRLSIDIVLIMKKKVKKKEDIIKKIINKQEKLIEKKFTTNLNFQNFEIDIGFLELDMKRQHLYPGVLFLTRKCLTKFIGTPLSKFLNKRGINLKSKYDLQQFKKFKQFFEGEPRLYDIRVEIFYSETEEIHYESKKIPPYFSNILYPQKDPILDVELPIELCQGKLELISKLPEEQTQNILNAFLDLRVIKILNLDIKISPEIIKKIEKLKLNLKKEYEKLFAYSYIRKIYPWNDIFQSIINNLKSKNK